jgi:predicted ester cyclase
MKNYILLLTLTVGAAACNCGNKNCSTDPRAAKNMAAQRVFTEEVFNKHNVAAIDTLVADDYVEHCPAGYPPNKAGLKKSFIDFIAGFPDMHEQVNVISADSNYVTIEYTFTGTNSGSMMGMAPTGKKVNIEGLDLIRYKNGKAVEHWGYNEETKMMMQLGMMPGMGGSDSTKNGDKKS